MFSLFIYRKPKDDCVSFRVILAKASCPYNVLYVESYIKLQSVHVMSNSDSFALSLSLFYIVIFIQERYLWNYSVFSIYLYI
jgi:hypothetical protein